MNVFCTLHYSIWNSASLCPFSPPESLTQSFRRNLESWGSIYWRAPMTWLLSKSGSSKVGRLLLLMVLSYGVLVSVLRHPVRLKRSTWFLERTVHLMNWEAVERLQLVPFACCSDLSYSCSDFWTDAHVHSQVQFCTVRPGAKWLNKSRFSFVLIDKWSNLFYLTWSALMMVIRMVIETVVWFCNNFVEL